MIRAIALFLLLGGTSSVWAGNQSAAAKTSCTRTNLQRGVDKYVEALKKGTPFIMPLATKPRYVENRKETPFGQGIWQTPLPIDFSRSLLDIETCQTFTEVISANTGHPYVLGTRMQIADNKIAEIETLVTDQDDWLFNAANYLKYSSRENWEILPPAQRSNRQTLIKAANAYFDVFSNPSSSPNVPWGIPCERLEGGVYTNPKGDPNPSCTGGPPLEGSGVQITNRRFIVDLDMGTVVGLMNFGGDDGLPDSHIFRLESGKIRYVHTLTVCTKPYCGFPPPATAAQTSLKEAFKKHFRIGAALNPGYFTETDAAGSTLVKQHFNSITPENDMKWERIHPRPDKGLSGYNFDTADKYVEFGEKNGMFVVGHCLVWHSQVPRWVFQDADGKPLAREALLQRMRDHILTVVGRYKGRVHGWDVVNEALNEDGTLRPSQWYNIIGEDYIAKAFEYAHEADPKAELYYNDYNLDYEAKWKGAVNLVKKLKEQGLTITAIGTQSHHKMDRPSVQQIEDSLKAFKELGVKVVVTELDVDLLPAVTRQPTADVSVRAEATAGSNPYAAGLPDDRQKALAQRYADIFAVFLKYRDIITRVTFWGVTDRFSWLNNFPAPGRTNYPLLFDREGKTKPAFDSVVQQADSAGKPEKQTQ
jgi:endo-1,4-beta-xylanase